MPHGLRGVSRITTKKVALEQRKNVQTQGQFDTSGSQLHQPQGLQLVNKHKAADLLGSSPETVAV